MEKKEFELVLQTVSSGLTAKIIEKTGLDEDTAIEKLYSSMLYLFLEQEKTKVWYYSVPKLYELFDSELKTGQLVLPKF